MLLVGLAVFAPGPFDAAVAEVPIPIAQTPVTIGTGIRFRSQVMGQERNINVYLPAAYEREPSRRWPVLYVIDGGVEQDFMHIAGLASLGGLSGMYPDMIVVGIETVDRRNELTTPTENQRYRSEFPTLGGAERFRRMIAEEVMPFVAANYRGTDERLVMGESLAGYFIVDTFLNAPSLFTHYFAISPSMWWDDMSLAARAPALLATQPAGSRALYLTTADEGGDHLRGAQRLAEAIRARTPAGLRFSYVPQPQEQHSTIYHGAALAALRWAYQERR